MVAAGAFIVLFPQRSGSFGHTEEVELHLIEQAVALTKAGKQIHAQVVADKGVGQMQRTVVRPVRTGLLQIKINP